jgi:WD40 repeat protein
MGVFDAWSPSRGPGHPMRVFDLAFHPSDTNIIASCSDDDTVRVWQRQEAGDSSYEQVCPRVISSKQLSRGALL